MRPLVLLGVILIVIGGFLLYRGGTFTTQKKVVDLGDIEVKAPEKHTIPTPVAVGALIVGVGLVAAGVARKT